jgi:hypothetical protein
MSLSTKLRDFETNRAAGDSPPWYLGMIGANHNAGAGHPWDH